MDSNLSTPMYFNASELIYMTSLFRNPPIARYLTFTGFLVIYLVTVTANGLLVYVITASARLRVRPMYAFMAALSCVDVAGATTTLPRIVKDVVSFNYISVAECVAQIFFNSLFLRVQSYVLAAMSLDRYVAICHPLRYGQVATVTSAGLALVAIACASALVALGYPVLAGTLRICKPRMMFTPVCDFLLLCRLSCDPLTQHSSFNAFASLMTTVAPLGLIVPTYALVLFECRKASTRASQAKAIHTYVTHFFVLLVFFSFHLFLLAMTSIPALMRMPPDYLSLAVTLYYALPGIVNPVIYGLRTAEIRRVLLGMVRGRGGVGPSVQAGDKDHS